MTCIAVKVEKKKITISGDTQTSWGNNILPTQPPNDKQLNISGKIFSVNGMIIGCAGQCAHIQMLRVFCKTNKPKSAEHESVLDWIISFKDWLNQKTKVPHNDIAVHGILIIEKKVFAFYDFLDVYEIPEFSAVGSGQWFAMGALDMGATPQKAVQIAIKYNTGCGGRVTTMVVNK